MQYFNTPEMPGSSRAYEFCKRLIKMGHEVEMITSYREPCKNNDWFKTNYNGIRVNWLPLRYSNDMNYLKRLKVFFTFVWKSFLKARRVEGDIIFASSTPLTIAIPAVFVSREKKLPMVFEVRDLWPDVPIAMKILKNPIIIYLAKLLEIWTYKNADSIVALSPEMKKGIVKKKIDPKKVAVIPNSSNLDRFKFDEKLSIDFRYNRPWLKNKPLLVYAGAFGRVNDLYYAVILAKALKNLNSDIRILLIGEGSEKKKTN